MGDIEEIECSLELPIGTRFYFEEQLIEVVETDKKDWCCPKCAFHDEFWCDPMCQVMICDESDRRDKKRIFFKRIKSVTD